MTGYFGSDFPGWF